MAALDFRRDRAPTESVEGLRGAEKAPLTLARRGAGAPVEAAPTLVRPRREGGPSSLVLPS